ncbi:hypothetical protein B7C51_22575 [Paenibacillus larvae subsp. pulvifaciens]|uniref:Uncharacterized protein n=1 Tax=Paenibacillus larvae subsp. pulvifaciens TaxID=1477 RepID=A0A1V0UXZ7_9BACL|nr:hypothetical protein [Paenibacillus larvae]ARF70037.1 hypothetical protein B7C51_22575 [Paenibacillus larvae subsp. pulvifaciens]
MSREYVAEHRSKPKFRDMLSRLENHAELPPQVDPYVWLFLYDLNQKNLYLQAMKYGISIDWKAHLSDMLRRSAALLSMGKEMERKFQLSDMYDRAYGMLQKLFETISFTIRIEDLPRCLYILQSSMRGAEICYDYAPYTKEMIGMIAPCSGVTLYKDNGTSIKYVGGCGDVRGISNIRLTDTNSYIARSYQLKQMTLSYTELKQVFYFCLPKGKYVITFHFPADASWDENKFNTYHHEALHGIIKYNMMMLQVIDVLIGGLMGER